VTVNSRQFFIQGYADSATTSALARLTQRTLFMIKPEGMKRLGDVLTSVEKSGLIVASLKSIRLDAKAAKEWVTSNDSMDSVDETMLSGSVCVVMDLRGSNAIEVCSSLCKASSTSSDSKSSQDFLYTSPSPDKAIGDLTFFFGSKAPRSSATCKSCSLCLVKPHAVAQGNAGKIIQAISSSSKMEISACEKISFTKQDCAEFLESYSFLSRFADHITEMSSGPCYAIEIRGEDVVSTLRAFAGPYDVVVAKELAPASLRARFGCNSIQNAVHVTDLDTDGTIECAFAFGS